LGIPPDLINLLGLSTLQSGFDVSPYDPLRAECAILVPGFENSTTAESGGAMTGSCG